MTSVQPADEYLLSNASGDECFRVNDSLALRPIVRCQRGDYVEILFNKTSVSAGEEPCWTLRGSAMISKDGELVIFRNSGTTHHRPGSKPVVLLERNGNAIVFDLLKPKDLARPEELDEIIVEGEENFDDLTVEWSLKLDCSEIKGALSAGSMRQSQVVYWISERLVGRVSEAVHSSLAGFLDYDAANGSQRNPED